MWYDAYAMHGECGEMDFDPAFKNASMMEQLGKILDSESAREVVDPAKFKPVNTVITDNGHEIMVHPKEAKMIRDAIFNMDSPRRLEIIKKIQTTEGLTKVLDTIRI
jgi:uncharacterized Fe-S center protein